MFQNVAFIGLGLIGGSLAQRIKEIYPQTIISAKANTTATIDYALTEGIIDVDETDLKNLVVQADLVIIATPIEKISAYVQEIAPLCKPEAIIIDIGSTKGKICSALKKYANKFIGGHPMAGTEKIGIRNSDPSILHQARFVLTPYQNTPTTKLKKLNDFLTALEFRTAIMSPDEHDAAVAAISHVPYFTAAALTRLADSKQKKTLAATGFKSCTRVAGSDPQWGIDISETNAPEILKHITALEKELKTIKALIKTKKKAALKKYLAKSRDIHQEVYP